MSALAIEAWWPLLLLTAGVPLLLWIAKPVPAVAVVTVMLAAGAGLGGFTVSENSASAQRTAYFASINPLHPAHLATQE